MPGANAGRLAHPAPLPRNLDDFHGLDGLVDAVAV
jgi:hypothetical protein